MIQELNGGHGKRRQDTVVLSLYRKLREDMAKLKKGPPLDIRRQAVWQSILIINCATKAWANTDKIPKHIWGLLNACDAGAIYNSTPGGIK